MKAFHQLCGACLDFAHDGIGERSPDDRRAVDRAVGPALLDEMSERHGAGKEKRKIGKLAGFGGRLLKADRYPDLRRKLPLLEGKSADFGKGHATGSLLRPRHRGGG